MDVTGEYEAIRSINKLFIIAAVIIGAAGSFFGRMLGKKIEENELAQKRFFENTSHELKTPLTAIRGYMPNPEQQPEDVRRVQYDQYLSLLKHWK